MSTRLILYFCILLFPWIAMGKTYNCKNLFLDPFTKSEDRILKQLSFVNYLTRNKAQQIITESSRVQSKSEKYIDLYLFLKNLEYTYSVDYTMTFGRKDQLKTLTPYQIKKFKETQQKLNFKDATNEDTQQAFVNHLKYIYSTWSDQVLREIIVSKIPKIHWPQKVHIITLIKFARNELQPINFDKSSLTPIEAKEAFEKLMNLDIPWIEYAKELNGEDSNLTPEQIQKLDRAKNTKKEKICCTSLGGCWNCPFNRRLTL